MSAASPTPVAAIIAEEIRRNGPMRFDGYMEAALYGPGGYYEHPPVGAGPAGDFVTSPHVHPVFGELLAEAIAQLHRAIGSPEPFRLIEVGAGDGTLLTTLLPALDRLLDEPTIEVVAVERSAGARAVLSRLDAVEARSSMPAHDDEAPAVVLAHEVLDNLPFRRVRGTPAGPREVWVGLESGRLVEVLTPTDPDLREPHVDEHTEIVVPTGAASFVAEALAGPAARALLAIDYGSDRGGGMPAHGYAAHTVVEDLLARPGETDITAGVDFGFVARHARALGLQAFETVSQTAALTALGLADWLQAELERQGDLLNTGRGGRAVGVWGGRSRATMLADPAGLGRFRWLVVTTPGVEEPGWLRLARDADLHAKT